MALSDRYVEKTRTWQDNWNNVVRNVLFQDEKLKELMLIPADTDIIKFRDKYFIRDGSTDELLTNEKVRIVCYDEEGPGRESNAHMRIKYKTFDIFVKEDVVYTADVDRLRARQVMIAERIKYLLLRQPVVENMRFWYQDEYDQWTKTVGYRMYRLTFWYNTTV